MSLAKAVRIVGAGGVEVLTIEDLPRPEPGEGEVLVEVAAAGLNRADCLQRKGFYPAPKGVVPDIPGLEYAGTVCSLGPGASEWSVGDRVMGICAGGAMSTHLAVHESTALAVPPGMKLREAAAIPEVFMTAYDALQQGGMSSGRSVLVHAIGSGVGSAALQLVKRGKGRVIGTSRSQAKLAKASDLGLSESLLVEGARFAKEVSRLTEGAGVEIILDFVGPDYLTENLKALAPQGRLVVIGLLSGIRGELPMGLLLAKRASIIGTVLRSRSLLEKASLTAAFSRDVSPGFSTAELSPVIDRVMPMQEIADAHLYMESNQSFGKIVMRDRKSVV